MRETPHWLLAASCIVMTLVVAPLLGRAESLNAESNAATNASESSEYLLRYKFTKDEVLNYQVDHKVALITTRPELVERVKTESHSRKNHRVVSLDSAGIATLELTIKHTKMSAQFGENKPMAFDSHHPDDCPATYRHVKTLIGKPLARVRVSPRGELLSSVPLLTPREMDRAKMGKSDEAGSSEALKNFLIEFPETPLKVGEGWTNTFKVKVPISRLLSQPITMQRSYELVKVEGQTATIQLLTAVITPINDGRVLGRLIQMAPSGMIEFDMEHGRLVSRTLTVDKTEIGVIGESSSMQAKSKRTERWVDPNAKTEPSEE